MLSKSIDKTIHDAMWNFAFNPLIQSIILIKYRKIMNMFENVLYLRSRS